MVWLDDPTAPADLLTPAEGVAEATRSDEKWRREREAAGYIELIGAVDAAVCLSRVCDDTTCGMLRVVMPHMRSAWPRPRSPAR